MIKLYQKTDYYWYYLVFYVLSDFGIGTIWYFVVLSDFGIGTFWYFVVLTYFCSFCFLCYFQIFSRQWYYMVFMVLSGFGTGTFWYFMVLFRENYTLARKEMELSVTI